MTEVTGDPVLVEVKKKGLITIPNTIRKAKNIKEGDFIWVYIGEKYEKKDNRNVVD